MADEITTTVSTESPPAEPTTVVVPVVVTPPAAETPVAETSVLVEMAEKLTLLQTEISSLRADVGTLSVKVASLEVVEEEPGSVVEVVPEPLPPTAQTTPPKTERHPLLALVLGKSVTKV